MPFFICSYGLIFIPGGGTGEKIRDIIILICFHLAVEFCYKSVKADSFIFSITVLLAWCWLIYEWWFVKDVSFYMAFGPSLALIVLISRLLAFVTLYKTAKEKGKQQIPD
ncbi:MAG: hypothetical protein OIF51_03370 [Cellvibrionaceae bacterium]|nr:hypothetical protein [Cellvibrionaceae bacterium]